MNKAKINLNDNLILRSENIEYKDDTLKKHLDEESIVSGSNSNGTYMKFPDGTMICTSIRSFSNVSVSSTWGSLYDSSSLDLGDFSQTFIDIPKVFITSHNTENSTSKACFIEWVSNTTKSNWGQTAVARPTSGSINLTFDLLAIGRWK